MMGIQYLDTGKRLYTAGGKIAAHADCCCGSDCDTECDSCDPPLCVAGFFLELADLTPGVDGNADLLNGTYTLLSSPALPVAPALIPCTFGYEVAASATLLLFMDVTGNTVLQFAGFGVTQPPYNFHTTVETIVTVAGECETEITDAAVEAHFAATGTATWSTL
jgi:hypothetical protein